MRTAYDLRNKEKRMKRKFWPAAMTALMALLLTCGFAACADTGDTGNDNPNDNPDTPEEPLQATEGLVFTLSQDGTEYFVTDYTGTAAEVYVPATHEGLVCQRGCGGRHKHCEQRPLRPGNGSEISDGHVLLLLPQLDPGILIIKSSFHARRRRFASAARIVPM